MAPINSDKGQRFGKSLDRSGVKPAFEAEGLTQSDSRRTQAGDGCGPQLIDSFASAQGASGRPCSQV